MTHHETAQVAGRAPTEDELRAWDWRAELRAQERSVPWLARRTGRAQQTVYNYATGRAAAPLDWLREVAIVLGRAAA